AATAGLLSTGCEVVDLGICPTPTVLYYTRLSRLAGAIALTASHNPEQWNGMKFVSRDGDFISPEELAAFRKLVKAGPPRYAGWDGVRPVKANPNAVYAHVNAIIGNRLFRDIRTAVIGRKLKVGVDAVNGAASNAALQLVDALGAEPVKLYCAVDPRKPLAFPRRPEPTAENITDLCNFVRERKLDLGIAFDPDGDRFSCADETGTALGEEATICLACKYVLARRKGPVVVNLSTSRAVDEVCAPFGVTVERTPVGEASVVERMKAVSAVLGGEGNGGVILPELNLTRDGLVAAATVMGLLSENAGPLSAIRQSLPVFYTVKTTLPVSREEFSSRVDRLVAEFGPARPDRRDGVRLDGDDYWLHCRVSNTEPIVRIIAEAREQTQAAQLVERARAVLAAQDKG
ncbi:phosphoglucosamine mutase, partial [candidate division WOR-3 bacterium]|nr:phosphoglucosamine mutase [candidate division WOR-3 bacterium]